MVTYTEGMCVVTAEIELIILSPDNSTFQITPEVCIGQAAEAIYTGMATLTANFSWDFDGGTATPGAGPWVQEVYWDTPGLKTVSLVVEEFGCTAPVFTQSVMVVEPLSLPTITCFSTPSSITFSDLPDPASGLYGYTLDLNGQDIQPPPLSNNSLTLDGLQPGDQAMLTLTQFDDGPCGDATETIICIASDCPTLSLEINEVPVSCLEGDSEVIQLSFELPGGSNSGTPNWSGPGIIDNSNGLFDPAIAGPGIHLLTLEYSDGPCDYTSTTEAEVNLPPSISNVEVICTDDGTGYQLSFDVTTADQTNTVVSDPVPSGETLNQEFDLVEACEPVIFSFTKDCNCLANAGTMAADLICGTTSISGQHFGDAQLGSGDILQFILHDNSGSFPGTIYGISAIPEFSFGAPLQTGTTYYISPVVGQDDGTGAVDFDDPCFSVGYGQPVVFSATPQISLPEGNITCPGTAIPLSADLLVPATIEWSPAVGLSCVDCPSPLASPDTTTTYTATVNDENGCVSSLSATIYVNEFPEGSFPEEPTVICPGSTFEFCAPEAVTYSWTGPGGYQSSSSCLIIPDFSSDLDGPFTLEATLANGCTISDQIYVEASPELILTNLTADTAICRYQFLALNAEVSNADYYFWFPISNVLCQNCPTTAAYVSEPTVFTLIALDESGCELQSQVFVDIKSGCPGSEVIFGNLTSDETGIGIATPPVKERQGEAELAIFPNPTTGIVHIRPRRYPRGGNTGLLPARETGSTTQSIFYGGKDRSLAPTGCYLFIKNTDGGQCGYPKNSVAGIKNLRTFKQSALAGKPVPNPYWQWVRSG